MNRRAVLFLTGIAAIGTVVPYPSGTQSSNAQNDSESRLSSLETRVSVLETAIAATPFSTVIPSSVDDNTALKDLTFSGSGPIASDVFHLDAGWYSIAINMSGSKYDYAAVSLIRVGKNTGIPILSELNQVPFTGQVSIQVPENGDYRLISSADGHAKWTMTLTKQ